MEQLIIDMAQKLGFTAERIWPQIVMLTYMKSLFFTILYPIEVAAYVVAERWYWRLFMRKGRAYEARNKGLADYQRENDDYLAAMCIGGLVVSVLLGFVMLVIIADWPYQLGGALYPEARTVLDLVKSAKP